MAGPISHRTYLSYIDKSREYYEAHGYEQPYRWAQFGDVPMTRLAKPLAECRVGMVTTAAVDPDDLLQPFVAPASPTPTSLATKHLHWHQAITNTEDLGSFLPIDHLNDLAESGRIGSTSERFYGTPTLYSQRRTMKNAAMVEQWCREDDVDVVLITPL